MTLTDPVLLRSLALMGPCLVAMGMWVGLQPSAAARAGLIVAGAYNAVVILILHVVAQHLGWWSFTTTGGELLGMPVDVWIGWTVFWGVIAAWPNKIPVWWVALGVLWVDLILMPAASGIITLSPGWIVGEFIGLLLGLIPGRIVARWTVQKKHPGLRATMHLTTFLAFALWIAPEVVFAFTPGSWEDLRHPMLWLQVGVIPLAWFVAAVREFVVRGGGPPIPIDPPERLVTTGPYAYVANPMQLSAAALWLVMALALRNPWFVAASLSVVVYGAGFAAWHERVELPQRWPEFAGWRSRVRAWIPTRTPVSHPEAVLWVDTDCDPCSRVGRWIAGRAPDTLRVNPALPVHRRLTYRCGDFETSGIKAIFRAMEHMGIAWATVSFLGQVPGVSPILQNAVDAVGGGPRPAGTDKPAPSISDGTH